MQKNLVLAVVLSSLVYIFWYSYMEKRVVPPAGAPAAATDSSQRAVQSPSTTGGSSPQTAEQPVSATLPADWKDKAARVKIGKAEYLVHPDGASIKSLVYEGPVAPVELVLSPDNGLFSSFEDLAFSLTRKNS